MPARHVDTEHMSVNWAAPTGDSLDMHDGVAVIITQAYGPTGEALVGLDGIKFANYPAICVHVRTPEKEGRVYLSPFHGDSRKSGFTTIPVGTRCELFCPVSGEPLDRAGPPVAEGEPHYYALYLSADRNPRSAVFISDIWGDFDSRVVDNEELISEWLRRHPQD